MDVLKAMEEKAFWGHEFLTWLWFRSETEEGEFVLPGQQPVNLWIEERLVLESLESESKENILKSGDVARSAEAAAGLAVGKKVTQARFGMARGDVTWTFLLDGATFDVRGMKIPPVTVEGEEAEEDEAAATMLLRLSLMRECLDVLDALYREFVELRLSGTWESVTVPAMGKWIGSKEGN